MNNYSKPNVLMITVDHWSAALLGVAGHNVIQTPTLDSMSGDGVRFTNCYSECPVCIPARRSLMTGTTPKTHGDRVYSATMDMPDVPTLAQRFRDAGYQAYAVGKLHVYPQRNRIGFDDVILAEEGRYQFGLVDDYQTWLAEQGYAGKEFLHGMGNNEYYTRPWHLPEECHATNWATREMTKMIKRKDPTRPAFYYVSYCYPHPPLVPLQCYLDMYQNQIIDVPFYGDWADDAVFPLQSLRQKGDSIYSERDMLAARKAFYAQCTHVDHQIRLLIGTLREEGILDNTIILFTADHGDMLGNHGLVAKRVFYESSANIPLIISGNPLSNYRGMVDDRLVCLADVMPTLLDLCNINIPDTVDGISAFSPKRREMLYGEISEGALATRMVHDGKYKLIYYPVGNYVQLFDLEEDPLELQNIAEQEKYNGVRDRMVGFLISNLYNGDQNWVENGVLKGFPNKEAVSQPNYSLSGQRGYHWPPPGLTL
ncbi:MAG: sulfatase-like hydrolase/transferase [Clostridiales bacterium]|nr:sulfatase-like hydrolase/transferase [Clostridiales bacterium]